MSTRRVTGLNNHAGDLSPLHSPYGQAMFAATGRMIAQPEPLQTGRAPYGGTVGGIATASASVIPLVADGGYFGDLPQDQQSDVIAANPWDRA